MSDRAKFGYQRTCAKQRGIPFHLTFEEWLAWWEAFSPDWRMLRGKGRGKYVMSRPGDKGPYALGNIEAKLHEANTSEGYRHRGDSHWSRRHPEKVKRGDQHHNRLYPERMARGDHNGMRRHPESCPRGARNGSAKLTDDLVRQIRANPRGQKKIAKELGVSKRLIGFVKHRRVWTHVD